jgi:hypothetical protein
MPLPFKCFLCLHHDCCLHWLFQLIRPRNHAMPCFLHDGKGLRYILLSTPKMIPTYACRLQSLKNLHHPLCPYCNLVTPSLVHHESVPTPDFEPLWHTCHDLFQLFPVSKHYKLIRTIDEEGFLWT